MKLIIGVTSKGKYPRRPQEGNITTNCFRDFRNLKEQEGKWIFEYLSKLITTYENKGLDPTVIKTQKTNLKQIKTLIDQGNEKIAFRNFIRSFPSCLPHRSR